MVGDRRQRNVRQHTPLLRAVTVGTIELLHGDLQRAEGRRVRDAEQLFSEVQQALDRPFAVGRRVADDEPSMIILNGAGQDLAGTGAELARQHHQGALPCHAGSVVGQDLHFAVRVLDLDHGPLVDEQAGQVDGFGETATAVAAEIQDHHVHAFVRKSSRIFRTSRVVLL